jgi:hypothetical protein
MRTLARTAVALGFVGAIAIGTTVPVMAEGVYLNAPGVHVGVGHHHGHYYDHYYDRDRGGYDRDGGGGWRHGHGPHGPGPVDLR